MDPRQSGSPSGPAELHRSIRELCEADAAPFQAMRLQALREVPSAFASSYEEECETPLATVAERLIPTSSACVMGAFNAATLVGIVGLQRETLRKLSHKAYIWSMYVTTRARGHGVGAQLVAAALSRAAAMPGVDRVNLGVNANNVAAIALYERMGFTSFGLERGFMIVDGQLHDEIHMVSQPIADAPAGSRDVVAPNAKHA